MCVWYKHFTEGCVGYKHPAHKIVAMMKLCTVQTRSMTCIEIKCVRYKHCVTSIITRI